MREKPNIPKGDKTLTLDEFEKRIVNLVPDAQKNMRALYKQFLCGKINQYNEKKLLTVYPELDPIKSPNSKPDASNLDANDVCYTYAELAERMMLHYQNPDKTSKLRITIDRKTISAWSRGKDLRDTPWPPKDLEGLKKRISLSAWCKWFDAHLWHKFRRDAGQQHDSLSPEISTKELLERAERSAAERSIFEDQVAKGNYIELSKAEQIAAGESNQDHLKWKNKFEAITPDEIEAKMQQLEIEPAKVAAMKDYLSGLFQNITNEIEAEAIKSAKEMERVLQAQAAMNKK